MSELQKYIIYKITCIVPDVEYCYVGSCKNFANRKYLHKSDSIKNNSKIYKIIREVGGFNLFKMEEIETIECVSNLDARIREQHFITTLNANLNTNKAYCTEEDKKYYNPVAKRAYYLLNKDKRIAYAKAYYKKKIKGEILAV